MKKCTHPLFQAAAVVTAALQIGATAPVYASAAAPAPMTSPAGQPAASVPAAAAPQPAPVQVRRTLPQFQPPSGRVTISENPSNDEIYRLRLFDEPLVPVGGASTPAENRALGGALRAWMQRSDPEDHSALEGFLRARPASPWRVALLTNLGIVYRTTGYFTKALDAWEQAWNLGKGKTDPRSSAITDRALAELAGLNARLGRADRLEALFAESAGRNVRGSATEHVAGARQGLHLMRTRPDQAFPCGPMAVEQILKFMRADYRSDPRLRDFPTSQRGSSLTQVHDLVEMVGLPMQMVKREEDTDIPVPAIVHWRAGHFAALLEFKEGVYRVQDRTFGNDFWVTRRALREETTGYFIIPRGPRAPGWRHVDASEGQGVWGKGNSSTSDPSYTTEDDKKEPRCETCPKGMAGYSVHAMLVSLNIRDAPLGYSPSRGPAIKFTATYNQREAFQPTTFSYSNIGPKWTFDWISYVEDNPGGALSQAVTVYRRGGGQESFTSYDSGTATYAPTLRSRAALVRTSTGLSPIGYQRRTSNGSKEIFAVAMPGTPRKVLLTQVIDPQGNTLTMSYDSSYRLVGVTDAVGQVTTLAYDLPFPKDLLITKITDPFGRYATFEYNGSGQLSKITDVIGISSEFAYGSGDFIESLTTPYGTTTFTMGESGRDRWLEIRDPLGATERVEYKDTFAPIAASETAVPSGITVSNSLLDHYNTFYWSKRAMSLYPGNYTKAKITRWLTAGAGKVVGVQDSEKSVLEGRVWYAYAGSAGWPSIGTSALPTKIARILDDGTTQLYQYDYNATGHPIRAVDPLGRETAYTYASNGIDLLTVTQKNGSAWDIVSTSTYNSTHRALTATDAAGQTTTFTYTSNGSLATVVTPPRGDLSQADRTTTYAYRADNVTTNPGQLETITAPLGGTTSFTYDDYGRTRTRTKSDNYTLTFDYDVLDRPTRTTYPDGTSEETEYFRLHAERVRDRAGRWTQRFVDPLQRLIAARDSVGRTTVQQWCSCGTLEKAVDANGNTTQWDHDAQGRVTKEIRANGSVWHRSYESMTSRLKTVTDPKGQSKITEYFADGQLKQVSYTNTSYATSPVSFTYDSAYGRIATIVDATGTTVFSYNAITSPSSIGANRLHSVDGPGSSDTITYGYDELGQRTSRTLDSESTTYGFDALNRVTSVTHPVGTFAYTYAGATNRRLSATYPNGTSSLYAYMSGTNDRVLEEIHHKFSGGATLSRQAYVHDPVGNVTTWIQQDESNAPKAYDYSYDARDQLVRAVYRTTDLAPTLLKRHGYIYDSAGNRTTEQADDTVVHATYDNMNRLTARQPGGALAFSGSTSEPAAVTVQGRPVATTTGGTFTGAAQVESGANTVIVAATDASGNTQTNRYEVNSNGGVFNYTYDLNGNLQQKSDGMDTWTYEWYADNALATVSKNGVERAQFIYDAFGRRRKKIASGVTTTYVYDSEDVLRETASSGATYSYVHGPGMDEPLARKDQGANVIYYHLDHLGSLIKATNSSGIVVMTRRYDPFGSIEQGASSDGYAFTGREWDADIQSYYYRARYYDSTTGRFLSEDALKSNRWMGLYLYVRNNPVVRVDPTGHIDKKYEHPKDDPGVGYYLCCSGQKLAYCRGGAPPMQDDCIEKCLIRHENVHVKDMQCRADVCVDKEDGFPVGVSQSEWNWTECRAYTDTWDCLKGCSDSPEKKTLKRVAFNAMWDLCGEGPPPYLD